MLTNLSDILPDYLVTLGFSITGGKLSISICYKSEILITCPDSWLTVVDCISFCLAYLTAEYSPRWFDPAPLIEAYWGGLP